MTGKPNFNRELFSKAAQALWLLGHDVINPSLPNALGDNAPLSKYMEIDLANVCRSDAICLLPGWENSLCADIEHYVARGLGKTILGYWPGCDDVVAARITHLDTGKHPVTRAKPLPGQEEHVCDKITN